MTLRDLLINAIIGATDLGNYPEVDRIRAFYATWSDKLDQNLEDLEIRRIPDQEQTPETDDLFMDAVHTSAALSVSKIIDKYT